MAYTQPVRRPAERGSINAAAGDAARVVARRLFVREGRHVVRLTRDSKKYGEFKRLLTMLIRDEFKNPNVHKVTFDFSLEVPPLLLQFTDKHGFAGIVWPTGFALWVSRRGNLIEVISVTSGEQSQTVHYSAILHQPLPEEEPVRRWWQLLRFRPARVGS